MVVTDVRVREVRSRRRDCVAERHLDVHARVTGVTRSKSGLRRGKRLRFSYGQRFQCADGPRRYNPASIAKGERVTVYLKAVKGKYTIAASVLSIVRRAPRRR